MTELYPALATFFASRRKEFDLISESRKDVLREVALIISNRAQTDIVFVGAQSQWVRAMAHAATAYCGVEGVSYQAYSAAFDLEEALKLMHDAGFKILPNDHFERHEPAYDIYYSYHDFPAVTLSGVSRLPKQANDCCLVLLDDTEITLRGAFAKIQLELAAADAHQAGREILFVLQHVTEIIR